ncbi:MAG: hypothetical protein GY777_20350 [Candidatus Brocadiaceae bacterium]|nr:hypothetical protein [Candidatus Brocadiaceae bacterium]
MKSFYAVFKRVLKFCFTTPVTKEQGGVESEEERKKKEAWYKESNIPSRC